MFVCLFVYRGEEELKSQRRNNEVAQKMRTGNVYYPLTEREGKRLRNRAYGLTSVAGGWSQEGLNHQGDAAASGGATQSETEGEKHPSFFPPPTTHLQPVIPVSQTQLTWEPGKLRLQGI